MAPTTSGPSTHPSWITKYNDPTVLSNFCQRVARHLSRPPGVEFADAVNDAVVVALGHVRDIEAGLAGPPDGVAPEAWFWVRVLGDTFDKYKTQWRRIHRGIKCVPLGPEHDRTTRADSDDTVDAETSLALSVAMMKLSPSQRATVEAFYFAGKTQDEIAWMRGESQAAVSQRLATAHKWLKQFLGEAYAG